MRLAQAALLLLFALLVTFRTVNAGDWPENYIVDHHTESPHGHYGVLVLSHQFAIDQNKTEGNTTYLANLQTRQTLGEINGTDYYKSENQCFLHVVWAPDSSACALEYEGRYGFDSVFLLELKGESFRQIDIAKHIQEALKRQFGVYAHFRFAPNGTLNVRALGYTNPKSSPISRPVI